MIVVDRDLNLFVGLDIRPEPEDRDIQPASIDLRLGSTFKSIATNADGNGPIDPETDNVDYWTFHQGDDSYELVSGGFVLASTLEDVIMPDTLAGQVIDKSSLARLGVGLHAGFIDPGFRGHITLEITNHSPRSILLRPGIRIGQLVLFTLSSVPHRVYGSAGLRSRYQNQPDCPVSSRSHLG